MEFFERITETLIHNKTPEARPLGKWPPSVVLQSMRAPGRGKAGPEEGLRKNAELWTMVCSEEWYSAATENALQNMATLQGMGVVTDKDEAKRLVEALRLLVACEGVALTRQLDRPSDTDAALARCAEVTKQRSDWEQRARDLCTYLQNEKPTVEEPEEMVRRSVRVVWYDRQGGGHYGKLVLDWLPDTPPVPDADVRLIPHPESLLLGTDAAFRDAFTKAIQWAKSKFALSSSGCLRWNLTGLSGPLYYANGGSIGGAIGAGLAFAWGEDYADLSIAISATIDEQGNLGRVDGLSRKLGSGLDATFYSLLACVNHEYTVEAGDSHHKVEVKKVSTMDEVLTFFQTNAKPRRELLKRLETLYGTMPFLESDRELPISEFYCSVPLLQEIKREKLPPSSRESTDEAADRWEVYREDMSAWHEAGEMHTTLGKPVSLGELFKGFSSAKPLRFVVLGDPGSGKSTLTRLLAWNATQPEDCFVKLGTQPLLPVVIPLRGWDGKLPLAEKLHGLYEGVATSKETWEGWLKRGELFLLFDGLDEADVQGRDNDLSKRLKEQISGKCPLLFTCRILSREKLAEIGAPSEPTKDADFPLYQLGSLSDKQKQTYVTTYFGLSEKNAAKREALIARLLTDGEYRTLSGNPMLLSLICFLAEQVPVEKLPRTRTDLYELAVDRLLAASIKDRALWRASGCNRDHTRWLLEQLALEMMGGRLLRGATPEQNEITRSRLFCPNFLSETQKAERKQPNDARGWHLGDFVNKAHGILEDWGLGHLGADEAIRKHLQVNSRILVGDPEPSGSGQFFHLSMQEFLAACGLARRVELGWDEDKIAPTKNKHYKGFVAVRDFVDRMSWLPEWEPTLLFFAARLKMLADESDKQAEKAKQQGDTKHHDDLLERRDFFITALCDFLALLADEERPGREERDDIFHERLALALFSLVEIRPQSPEEPPA